MSAERVNVRYEKGAEGTTVTLTLSKQFDFNCAHDFRAACLGSSAFMGVANSALPTRYIIDLSNTCYIDSCALGMLMSMYKALRKRGVSLQLINCNSQLQRIFSVSNFDRFFVIEAVIEAVAEAGDDSAEGVESASRTDATAA